MALGSTQALKRNEYQGHLLGDKDDWSVGLTALPPSCADCPEILGTSTSWNPKGLYRPLPLPLFLKKMKANEISVLFLCPVSVFELYGRRIEIL